MIKDEKLRDALLQKFPELTPEEKDNVEKNYMSHYVLYKRIKKGVYKCHCTRCGKEFVVEGSLEHNKEGMCPECDHSVTYLSEGRGKGYIYERGLFALFHVVDGNLYINCFDIYKTFSKDNKSLVFKWHEEHRYCLTPGAAQHWGAEQRYNEDDVLVRYWRPMKSEHARTEYTLINDEAISETFLKHAAEAADNSKDIYIKIFYISYLCIVANHPNLEYLMKTGFEYIVSSKLRSGSVTGIRINYRSNNVKKMLKLNKEEMELLKNTSCETLSAYYTLRKADSKATAKERVEVVKSYMKYSCDKLAHIIEITGISLHKAVNYIKKQKETSTSIYDWEDYIRQCQTLKYDVSDTGVTMPKNLARAHERLTRIIKIKASKEKQKELERTNKKRKKFDYVSENGEYVVILPKTIQEIIDEGKRLDHCVGGYADRHAEGVLTILFLRKANKPKVPYYTMEISKDGRIVQCRGYKNNTVGNYKPKEIIDFEAEYQAYLNTLFKKTRRKSA